MKDYGRIRGPVQPQATEITQSSVFIASNIASYTDVLHLFPLFFSFCNTISGYEYNYIEYTKDEYLLQQSIKIASLEQELQAAKILLGVD